MTVPVSKTKAYRRVYDQQYREANRDRRRQWDRDHAKRIKNERRLGACVECGTALSVAPQIRIDDLCKECREWEAVARLQQVVDAFMAGKPVNEIAAEVGKSANNVSVTITTLRACGHPIPRRRGAGAGWKDPLPSRPIVIGRGDYTRGQQLIKERAAATRAAKASFGKASA